MGTIGANEDSKDTISWNKRIRRQLMRYDQAKEENRIDDKKAIVRYIMELMYEKACFDYELDGVLLEAEQMETIQMIEDIVSGRKPVIYKRTQENWNEELTDALEHGRLMRTIALTKVGKKLAFVRKPGDKEEEQYNAVKQIMQRMEKTLSREGR